VSRGTRSSRSLGARDDSVERDLGLTAAGIIEAADFFEDPTTWGLLGLAALSAAALERRREERV